jgi:hypothetical protein
MACDLLGCSTEFSRIALNIKLNKFSVFLTIFV